MPNKKLVLYLSLAIAACCIAVLILFSFGEKDHFKWWGLVDDDKIANLFTSIEAICFIAGLFFAAWQLQETYLGRIMGLKPYLWPLQTSVTFKELQSWEIQFIRHFNREESPGLYVPISLISEVVNVKNNSKSAAYDVAIEWKYDESEVTKVIQTNQDTELEIDNNRGSNNFSVAFMNPEESIQIPICSYYFLMFAGHHALLNFLDGTIDKYPSLELTISAHDIADTPYINRFDVSVSSIGTNELTINFARIK